MSFTWTVHPTHPAAESLAQALGCPVPFAQLLAERGHESAVQAHRFLNPALEDLHDPSLLTGLSQAVSRIQQALADHESILIYGDYDVDGTVATVLLKTAIERVAPRHWRGQVYFHVPHRLREGYGIQPAVLADYAARGVTLVISVDTGIRAFAAAASAQALGVDLIVTDHHLPDTGLPAAVAVVNPNQAECTYPNKDLCGAGVAFKLAHALLLAAASTPEQRTRLTAVLLPSLLKLLAIATVADSVPLTGENRTIVALGLRSLAHPVQPGLRALLEVAEVRLGDATRPPTPHEIAFRVAPRINAAGRMDVASDVVDLLLTRSPELAAALAGKLDQLNRDRRATEAEALTGIELQLLGLRQPDGGYPLECIVLDHPEWHRGVLGILASRVVNRTGRPALILTLQDGDAHGSGRSVPGFHLLDALTAIHPPTEEEPELVFHRFGGHAHAVGFSLPAAHLQRLRERLTRYTAGRLTHGTGAPVLSCDLALSAAEVTVDLAAWIARCGPFGIGNPEPLLQISGLVLAGTARVIKERHLSIPVVPGAGGSSLSLLGWSRGQDHERSWPERLAPLDLKAGTTVDAVGRLVHNPHPSFGGLELHLEDLRLSRVQAETTEAPA